MEILNYITVFHTNYDITIHLSKWHRSPTTVKWTRYYIIYITNVHNLISWPSLHFQATLSRLYSKHKSKWNQYLSSKQVHYNKSIQLDRLITRPCILIVSVKISGCAGSWGRVAARAKWNYFATIHHLHFAVSR